MPLAYPPFKSCPCGSGRSYGACCGPAHDGSRPPATPETLMRARYTAYALGNVPFVLNTWHVSTRPQTLDLNDGTRYVGLRVHAAAGDTVDFTASLKLPGGERYSFRERSHFEQVGGAWVYVQGEEVEG